MIHPSQVVAVIIAYHPPSQLCAHIQTYLPWVQQVYVYDNTETGAAKNFTPHPKITWQHDGENKGIAARLNEAANKAINDGATWLLTMDQDSFFEPGVFEQYLQCVQQLGEENTAIIGVNYDQRAGNTQQCHAVEAFDLITSGSLHYLPVYKELGPFDEALFIDGVDHDYCLRCHVGRYKSVRLNNIALSHQLGTVVHRSSIKTLWLVKKKKSLHSPLRCYYIYRNFLYLQHKYKEKAPQLIAHLKKTTWSELRNNIFYHPQPHKIVQAVFTARKDFKLGRMGKKENF